MHASIALPSPDNKTIRIDIHAVSAKRILWDIKGFCGLARDSVGAPKGFCGLILGKMDEKADAPGRTQTCTG